MKFSIPKCPSCNELATGTLETVQGIAVISFDKDGGADYGGHTEMDWDSQRTVRDQEENITLVCDCGNRWQSEMEEGE